MLSKININSKKLFKNLSNVLFYVMILINSAILVLFWVKINLI